MSEFGKWTPVTEALPKEDGRYLCTISYFSDHSLIVVRGFTTDLYKLDDNDFREHKKNKKSGFYDYDSEWGFTEIDSVVAWMPLPEPYKGE